MKNKIIIALDYDTNIEALNFVYEYLKPTKYGVKIGTHSLLNNSTMVEELKSNGYEIMLDCKFHDTPDTVARYVRQAKLMEVDMITVHSIGGPRMLYSAVEAANVGCGTAPLIIAVTILTSMDEEYLRYHLQIQNTVLDQSLQSSLELIAYDSGCNGIVLNGSKVLDYKKEYTNMLAVVPGIRGTNDQNNCQKVVVTPEKALNDGADFLIIGRYVTASNNKIQRLNELNRIIE